MGGGFIPQNAWTHLEKDENLVEVIRTSKLAYVKAFESYMGHLPLDIKVQ
jgi:hypothetical protein